MQAAIPFAGLLVSTKGRIKDIPSTWPGLFLIREQNFSLHLIVIIKPRFWKGFDKKTMNLILNIR